MAGYCISALNLSLRVDWEPDGLKDIYIYAT